jgi:uncharacterized protein YbbC (DUF1343 family)
LVGRTGGTVKLGVDRLIEEATLGAQLAGRRVALLGHPASMTRGFVHSLDALAGTRHLRLCAGFGPQHGMLGDKQDNMVETQDAVDPRYGIPIFSLYGAVRRLTPEMLEPIDVLLVDLQDVGCRVYTFLTTLCWALEDCGEAGKAVWVLERPNPAGRPVDGLRLLPGAESFVGVGPLPMRHGLTLGEAALWYAQRKRLDLELRVVTMFGYDPWAPPGYGWPLADLAWVNPSPNIATLYAARAYSGTVLLEGTTLSEGRGTTRPLEVFGAPGLDSGAILAEMQGLAPTWLEGCGLRVCTFEPTFHKHSGQRCQGIQVHTDAPVYDPHRFRPYRLVALFLKALRRIEPDYPLWRDFPYEYVTDRLAIDVISGGPALRQWVDDTQAAVADLDAQLGREEVEWAQEVAPFLLYPAHPDA